MNKEYKFLDDINFPSDIRKLSVSDLKNLADEVRTEMIDAVSVTSNSTSHASTSVLYPIRSLPKLSLNTLRIKNFINFIKKTICGFMLEMKK